VTSGAQIIRALDVDRAQRCHQVFGPNLVKPCPVAASAVDLARELHRSAQELFKHLCAQLMGRGACGHFNSFQIEMATLAQPGEDDFQQYGYFSRRFTLDRVRRFFSCGDNESSTGRARQICEFTSTYARLNS